MYSVELLIFIFSWWYCHTDQATKYLNNILNKNHLKILDQHVKKTRLQRLGAPRNTSLMTLASQAKEPFSFSKTKLLCFAYQIYVSFVLSKLFYHNWQLTIVTTKKIKSGSKLSLHFQHKDFKSKKKKKKL